MSQKSKRGGWRWLVAVMVIAAMAGGFYFFRKHEDDKLKFNAVPVSRGSITQVVTATGTINPVVNVTVGSQVSGRICKLNVDFNSIVKSNEVIAEIDPSTYQAALEQAEADLANAKANLELQEVEAKRSAELFTNNLISSSDYDTAIATLHEAQASVKIKEASVRNAQANLGYCKIVSPVNGVVISRAVDLGQTVASSFSTPTLFQIASDLTRMQIDAAVDEADIGGVKDHQPVNFTVDAYPNRTFHGVVTQVRNAPTTVNNVVTYDTVISVTNADYSLKPGMTADVSIIVAQRHNVLEIPNSALRFQPPPNAIVETNTVAAGHPSGNNREAAQNDREPGRHDMQHVNRRAEFQTVYLLEKGPGDEERLKPVKVKTGITDNINTEVLSGLKPGDQVVTGQVIPGLDSKQMRNPFSRHRHF